MKSMRTAGQAQAIAVLGTASDVGKSVIAAGLCRLLYRAGVRVAPFKAQNMSLNSFVTPEGGEMGRAQVVQAHACGLQPHVDMNPILLKPQADQRSQVIVQGKVLGCYGADNYLEETRNLFAFVQASYRRLAQTFDVIVIEGAGSAAEMNLRDRDLVNWPVVKLADARVLLVADIDWGGVFAQVIGTLDLLEPDKRARVVGVLVNKFRGDPRLFDDGVAFLEKRTGLPVLGVIPFLRELELDQEDSVGVERYRRTRFGPESVNIAVILLPRMSNFTDFNALAAEPDVALRYVASPDELSGSDVVLIPGSKNTIDDLAYIERVGFFEALREHVCRGAELVGICGGYQMLGREVSDPHGVEGGGRVHGLGFLDVVTELLPHKCTVQVEAVPLLWKTPGCTVHGYEIHMGITRRGDAMPVFQVLDRTGQTSSGDRDGHPQEAEDGAVSKDGRVWGSYLHGLFDQPGFRRCWLNRVRERKGLVPLDVSVSQTVTARLQFAIDRWADHLGQHVDVESVFDTLNLDHDA